MENIGPLGTVRVAAAVITDGERVFAVQRGHGKYKDKWEFPGGKIEEGESPEEALKREILEEHATEISVGRKIASVVYDYPEFRLSMDCFLSKVVKGDLSLIEAEDARWLSLDELGSVDWLPADLSVLDAVRKEIDPGNGRMAEGKKVIMFDLDGTLLPMDLGRFMKTYFRALTDKFRPMGYDAGELEKAVWAGSKAMMENGGRRLNEEAFWEVFGASFGGRALRDREKFDGFYENDFSSIRSSCGFAPEIPRIIGDLKKAGYRLIVATNPFFPLTAQRQRVRWAGLDPEDFIRITGYENSSYIKPDPGFFREIMDKEGLRPEECLMVGNDADEDMCALEAGIDVFILTPCLINRRGRDLSAVPHGGYGKLREYLGLD